MVPTMVRYRQTNAARFRELLLAWLKAMPRGGFKGTVGELEDELLDFQATSEPDHAHAAVPIGVGLSKALIAAEGAIQDAGYRVWFTRTATTRFIHLTSAAAR